MNAPPAPSTSAPGGDIFVTTRWTVVLQAGRKSSPQSDCALAELFTPARGHLMVGEAAIPHAEAAAKLGMDEGAVRVAVHRLRKRYRELLRDEIGQTVNDPAQVAEELRSLQVALASS